MTRWQPGMEKYQTSLGRIVDIGAKLFATTAACVYAQTIDREHPGEPSRCANWLTCSTARRTDASTGCSPACGQR